MVQNIDSILQRGERLDLLVDKTDTLAGQAYAFRRGARNVRRQQWWKNMRIMMLTGVVGVVSRVAFASSPWETKRRKKLIVQLIFYLLMAQFCGLSLAHCRS